MATGKALDGKPYAGNPHVRFDEGVASLRDATKWMWVFPAPFSQNLSLQITLSD